MCVCVCVLQIGKKWNTEVSQTNHVIMNTSRQMLQIVTGKYILPYFTSS